MTQTRYRWILTAGAAAGLLFAGGCGMFDGKDVDDDVSARPTDTQLVLNQDSTYAATFDPDLRRQAVAKIAASSYGGEPQYVEAYRILLRDEDPLVQAAAARALGIHGQPADAKLLAGLLRYEEQSNKPVQEEIVRWEAAKSLSRLHDPEVASPLVDAMTLDDSTDVRASAAFALGQYPRKFVVDTLLNTLTDTDYTVSASAQRSLFFLTGQDFGDDIDVWEQWVEKNESKLFDQQVAFTYQAYGRDRSWFHFLPFVDTPPKDGRTLPPKGFKLGN